ncbi:MAG: hypothetical protein ABIH39_02185 [Candidatus Margulisiibacteriota bacterium]
MVKGTDWYSSSVYRAGWKGGEGIVRKAHDVSYVGMYQVPDPSVYREKIKWRAKSIMEALFDEETAEDDEILKNCIKKGMGVFANRKG